MGNILDAPARHGAAHLQVARDVEPDHDQPGAGRRGKLWAVVGEPDPAAGRTYLITTASGPLMLIAETDRDGMLTCAAPANRQVPQ